MLSFYDFDASGGGGTDVLIAVQDFAVPSNTGSANNFTTSAFGGVTPSAAIIVSSNYDPASGGGHTTHAQMMIGTIADGQVALGTVSRSSFDTRRRIFNTDAFALCREDNATARWRASGALIADGISLTGINAGASTSRVAAFAGFAGADVNAKNGIVSLGTGTSPISVTCGFEPDFVLLFGAHLAASASAALGSYLHSIGACTKDGSQRSVLTHMSAIGTPYQALLTNRAGGHISGGSLSYDLTVGGFSSSGFEITPSASASSVGIGYFALKIGGKRAKIVDLTTPTSTGSQAITGVGFEPQFALVVLTNLEATDPTFPISTSDLMASISISLVGDEQWATSAFVDSGTVASGSQRKNAAVIGASSTDGDAISATLTSFDSDGMTLNYTAVQGTAKKGFILFVE